MTDHEEACNPGGRDDGAEHCACQGVCCIHVVTACVQVPLNVSSSARIVFALLLTQGASTLLFLVNAQQASQPEKPLRHRIALKQGIGLALALPAEIISPDRIVASFFNFPVHGSVTNFNQDREGGRGESQPGRTG